MISIDPQTLIDIAPSPLERAMVAGYYKYASQKADQAHTPPKQPLSRQSHAPAHVLLLVVDALRPDFEPEIDMEFSRAITPGTWTFPAVTSILTGRYPHEHGAVAHTKPSQEEYVMPKQANISHTISSILEAAGFETYGGFAFMTPFLASKGWFQSHRVYRDASAGTVLSDYLNWRTNRDRTLGYVHLGDLHAPISPPVEYIEKHNVDTSISALDRLVKYTDDYDGSVECKKFRSERLKLYAAALDYVEDVIGDALDSLDNTAVIIIGDHGEAHWEHYKLDKRFTDSRPNFGVGHGGTPFDMVARVPIAFQSSNGSQLPDGGHISLCDIANAIGDLTVKEHPFDGPLWNRSIPQERPVICEATRYGAERKAIYMDGKKLIRSETDDEMLLAEIDDESGERFVSELRDETVSKLIEALPDYWEDGNIQSETSRVVKEQLSALGYK